MHLTIELDKNIYYDAPAPSSSSVELTDFLEYFNNLNNKKKYLYNTNLEKELLYYFEKISDEDKKEIIEFTKIKARKQKYPKSWIIRGSGYCHIITYMVWSS